MKSTHLKWCKVRHFALIARFKAVQCALFFAQNGATASFPSACLAKCALAAARPTPQPDVSGFEAEKQMPRRKVFMQCEFFFTHGALSARPRRDAKALFREGRPPCALHTPMGNVAHAHGQRCTRPWATLHTAADNPPGGIPARQSPSTPHVSQRQSRLIPSTYKYFATFAAQTPCPQHYMGTTDVHASKTNREQGHQLTKTHNHIKPTHIYSLF